MTVLKWLAALALFVYFGGLALLYFAQRSILFPIPETRRTSPKAAGFPQAEEHLLQTTDGEKLVAWHVAAARRANRWWSSFTAMAISLPGARLGLRR